MDFIGVLEHEYSLDLAYNFDNDDGGSFYPRILFGAVNIDNDIYKLDFQDINLVRTRFEGGINGDPYEPLTVENDTFTIHSFGGSGWKWSEATTFKYMLGEWYKVNEESIYGNGPWVSDYTYNDYETGKGVRGYNNSDWGFIENINETIVFRLTIDNENYLSLYSNDYTYSCGAFVDFDSLYMR
jgi:hypothetical protein